MEIIILILLVGIGSIYLGYGPLSLKKNPKAGAGFAVVGFLLRVVGPLFLAFGLMLLGRVLL
jgi:hypothetical protein